jgi:hypothetical protein
MAANPGKGHEWCFALRTCFLWLWRPAQCRRSFYQIRSAGRRGRRIVFAAHRIVFPLQDPAGDHGRVLHPLWGRIFAMGSGLRMATTGESNTMSHG